MTRRVLDVSIRSEFRKGFGDVAKALQGLESKLGNVAKLTEQVSRLATKMDGALAMKQAQSGVKKLADAQTKANKAVAEGVRTAKQYESASTKLERSLGSIATAHKAGSINAKQRMEAEISLLNKYIKKTNDLSVLQNKNNFRNSKGQFVSFRPESIKAVQGSLPVPKPDKVAAMTAASMRQVDKAISEGYAQQEKRNLSRSNKFFENLFGKPNAKLSSQDRAQLTTMYRGLFDEADKLAAGVRNRQAATQAVASAGRGSRMGTQSFIDRSVGVQMPNAQTGLLLGGDGKFNQLKLQYQALEGKAGTTAARIKRMNFGPNPAIAEPALKRLMDSYTRLGHLVFQLQYSTLTLFGATGIAMVVQQADAFITLQNQVARTSTNIEELSANMKDVYKISMQTFSDPKTVGNMFSRINKYSESLNLSREQVAGVVGGISGAFAASPGNAQEKSASQYQFMQAIQSNRLGGDELRSVLEMAPYVGDILGKGIAKLRGQEGVIDLRAQGDAGTPVTAKEIVAVFNDPAIQAEIKDMLGRQARTFGDLLMVGKTRLMQMTEQFSKSTGAFSGIINMLARFIMDDTKFAAFTNAIVAATSALVIYGTMMATQAAAQGARNIAGVLGNGLSFGLQRSVVPMTGYGPILPTSNAKLKSQALGAGLSNLTGSVKGGAGKALDTIAPLFLGLGSAIDKVRKPTELAKNAFEGTKSAVSNTAASMLLAKEGFHNVSSKGQIGSKIIQGMGAALGRLGSVALRVAGFLTSFSLPLIVIAGIVALLSMRFNKLLGSMTGGMNIMDILVGTWNMLKDVMSSFAKYVSETWVGKALGSFLGFLDGILKAIATATGNVQAFKDAQADRMTNDNGVFVNGKLYEAQVNADGTVSRRGNDVRNANPTAAEIAAAYRPGMRPMADRNLPSSVKTDLPTTPTKKGDTGSKGLKDPWPEFIRDLNLKIQSVLDLRNVAPGMSDIQSNLNDNLRRAMDVMNFDSSEFTTLTDAWNAFAAGNAEKARKVTELNVRLTNERLAEAMRDLTDDLVGTLISMRRELRNAGLSDYGAKLADARDSLFDTFLASGAFTGTRADYEMFRNMEANGGIGVGNPMTSGEDNRSTSFKDYFKDDQTYYDYMDQVETRRQMISETVVRGKQKELRLANQAFALQQNSLQYFGKARETQESINSLTNEYLSAYGELDRVTGQIVLKDAAIAQQLEKQIELVRAKAQAEKDYQSQYKNGFGEAIAEYMDGLNNIAEHTKTIFGNALQGLEDGFVNMFTATDLSMEDIKSGIHDLLKSVQADVARLFVKQFIMKPITGFVEGIGKKLFRMNDPDQTINANNVYINGTQLGGVGSMLEGSSNGINLGNIFGGSKEKAAFNGGGWMGGVDSSFSGAGGGGGGFMSSLMGMLKGGIGKASGGLGSLFKMVSSFLPGPLGMIGKLFSLFHNGGTVGESTMSRYVNPSVFSGARRYHTGGTVGMPALAVGEVPAILQQGEKVLTASQYSAMNNSSGGTTFSPSISVSYTAHGGDGGQGGQGTEDHAKNVGAMVKAAVNEAIRDYDEKQRKPGSAGYLANRR